MFNTREIAYLIWGTLLLIVLFFSGKNRSSLIDLIKAFFCKQFVYVYLIALTYLFICVWVLYKVKIWDSSLIKDTVMWFLFVALPLMYNAAKINSFQKFVKQVVRPLVAFSIIYEYIFGLYTFDWWIEILMVPVAVFIGGMLAFSEKKPEHRQVHKLMNGIFILIGLISLAAVVIHLIHHYTDYLNRLTAMQFIMPLCLSLMFVPFLYGIAMFTHYETAFVALKSQFKLPGVYKYTMLKVMLRFHGDLEGMERWKRMAFTKNLQTRKEVDEAITLVKTLQDAEQNPHTVNEGLGWSPYQVKDLLVSKGIESPDYRNTIDEEFCSISLPFKLSDDPIFSDTITYMVLGDQLIATELHIGLKVFNGTINNTASLMYLLQCSEMLHQSVFGEGLPDKIKNAIIKAKNTTCNNVLAKLSVKKELWTNRTKGYSMDFKITHNRHRV
ncbi:hypothetical protein [Pedobacter sp.]|jgi:hypothetical protein|uniref:hypothetical protein n=1 Tax=Pedobacter sp. TaxID=1411316 RepID=UPI002B625D7E|nr:hypothetical protein [Pedobacter sp.]HWW40426.1 hypothetical protein [Pedobacter sp.]